MYLRALANTKQLRVRVYAATHDIDHHSRINDPKQHEVHVHIYIYIYIYAYAQSVRSRERVH